MSQNDPVAIIDYQLSNLFSVKHACDAMGIQAVITSDPRVVSRAPSAILPGVGAFADAMANLKKFGLIGPIMELIQSGRKFMGVCLGLQLLFDKSSEFGNYKGLGIISGEVVQFPKNKLKVPQIGWNTIYSPSGVVWTNTPLSKVKNQDYMYFVHSFYVKPKKKQNILSLTNYGGVEYCSAIIEKNVFAVQFHPEKSGQTGIEIYRYCI